MLLALDTLEHRERVEDEDRAQVPIPVLLIAHSWDCSAAATSRPAPT